MRPVPLVVNISNDYSRDGYTSVTSYNPNLSVYKNSIIDVISASIPYTYPNIASSGVLSKYPLGNNSIAINFAGGGVTTYTLPEGLYSFTDVEFQLNQIAITNGWIPGGRLFVLNGVSATQKIIFSMTPQLLAGGVFPVGNIVVTFNLTASIAPVLGLLTSDSLTGTGSSTVTLYGTTVADFSYINSYIIHCSICQDSYLDGGTSDALAVLNLGEFTLNSINAYKPSLRCPISLNSGVFSQVSFYITDENNNRLLLSKFVDNITLTLLISIAKSDGSI